MVYRWATDNEVDGYGLYISQSLTKISRDPRVPRPLEQWGVGTDGGVTLPS